MHGSSVAGSAYGTHMACRYAVQYEDGDKEEFVISELKKKNMLQPAGVEQRTDFAELDRVYSQAQSEWAAGTQCIPVCSMLHGLELLPRNLMSESSCLSERVLRQDKSPRMLNGLHHMH